MKTTTQKLRKTLMVLLAIVLMLLPNLIVFADNEAGVVGTPTPDPSATPQVEYSEGSPTAEQSSGEPTYTPTDGQATDEVSENPPAEQQKPSETPSDNPPAEQATPSNEPSDVPPAEQATPSNEPSDVPPAEQETPSNEPSDIPPAEQETPSNEPSDIPPAEQETPSNEPSDVPPAEQETPSNEPSDVPPAEPQQSAEAPSESPTGEEVTPENSGEPTESPSEDPKETATPTPEPPVERLMVMAPQGEPAKTESATYRTLNFTGVTGLSQYTYSYTYYYWEYVIDGYLWGIPYGHNEVRSGTDSGTVTGNGSTSIRLSEFLAGTTSVTVHAHTAQYYSFKQWKHSSPGNHDNNPVTFNYSNITLGNTMAVELNYKPPTATLTFSGADGLDHYVYNGNTYTAGQSVTVVVGTNVSVTAFPTKHWENNGWETPSLASGDTATFIMPSSNTSVKANFEHVEFLLEFTNATGLANYTYGGNTYNGGDSVWVRKGTPVSVQANPAAHYDNSGWTTPPLASGDTATFIMPSNNTSVEAQFRKIEFLLTFEDTPGLSYYQYTLTTSGISGTMSGGQSVYIKGGEEIRITAFPVAHYTNDGWSKTVTPNVSDNTTLSFEMPPDDRTSIRASFFQHEYDLSFVFSTGLKSYSYVVNGGTEQYVTSSQSIYIPTGASVSVTAVPEAAYAIDGWNRPSGASGDTVSFTMDGPKTADAKVKEDGYYLTLIDGLSTKSFSVTYGGKTDELNTARLLLPKNASVTVTANGLNHTIFDFWATGHNSPATTSINGNTWSFTMQNDYILYSHFAVDATSHLTVKYDSMLGPGSGSISVTYNGNTKKLSGPGTEVTFKYNPSITTMTITANADSGSMFMGWTNHGNVTSKTMTINIPTGQGAATPAARSMAVKTIAPLFTNITLMPKFAKLGSLTVTKVDQDDHNKKLSGAAFSLTGPNNYSQSQTTPISGVLTWDNLPTGTYTLTETSAPLGYEAVQTSWNVVIDDNNLDITKTIENKASYCSLTVRKVDADNNLIAVSATFELWLGNTLISSKTETDGTFTWDDLKQGEYTIKETSAPSGYYWETQKHDVTLTPSEQDWPRFTKSVVNLEYGKLIVYKTDQNGTLLTGATFTLNGVGGVESPVDSGTYVWKDLKPGDYTLDETLAPSGYYINGDSSQSVTIEAGKTKEISVMNYEYVNIQVQKLSNFTNLPLQGAEFKIEDSNGQIGATQTTDATGVATFGDDYELKAGVAYTVTEVSPPANYQNDSTPVTITVNSPGEINKLSEAVFENTPILQKITVVKYLDQVATSTLNGVLDGTKFELFESGNSTAIDSQTLLNGVCEFTGLLPGNYVIKEASNDANKFFVSDNDKSVTLNLVAQEGTNTNVNFTNTHGNADFTIRKTDSKDQNLGLKDAVYELIGKKWTGTEYVPVTYQLRTDSYGYAVVRRITPGIYLLKEVTAPFGYAIDPSAYQITILPGRSAENVFYVSNVEYERGRLTLTKRISNYNEALPGATFSLYKKTLSGDVLVSSDVTNAQGNIIWGNLQSGNYVLVEDSAPTGYTILTKSSYITIDPGESAGIVLFNDGPSRNRGTVITPEPVPAGPESTPSPSPTPTPAPTPTATPIEGDELIIEDVDPAFGPETGEGDALFITIGILLLMGCVLFVLRKRFTTHQ